MTRIQPLAAALFACTAAAALAQTPGDLLDMLNAVAGPADQTLVDRGYRRAGSDGASVWWWAPNGGCVRIALRKGRWQAIDTVPAEQCGAAERGAVLPPPAPPPVIRERPPIFSPGPARPPVTRPDPYRPDDRWMDRRRLTLVCFERDRSRDDGGYRWDEGSARYAPRGSRYGFGRIESIVQLELDGDRGSIAFDDRYGRMAGGGGERGWYRLTRIVRDGAGFTARFKTALWTKAHVDYDARSRRIWVRGATDFSGTCAAGDWDRGRY